MTDHTPGVREGMVGESVAMSGTPSTWHTSWQTGPTMPTGLPGASLFLGMPYTECRKMVDAGLGVALASDYNPGSSPSGNMRMVMALGSIRMRLTPAESLNATTLNGAYAMGLSEEYGSITVGKVANFFLTRPLPSLAFFPYAYQTPLIEQVWLRGEHYA